MAEYLNNIRRVHFKATKKINLGISNNLQYLEDYDLLEIKKNYYIVRVNGSLVNRKGGNETRKRIRSNRLGTFMSMDFLPNDDLPDGFKISKTIQVLCFLFITKQILGRLVLT